MGLKGGHRKISLRKKMSSFSSESDNENNTCAYCKKNNVHLVKNKSYCIQCDRSKFKECNKCQLPKQENAFSLDENQKMCNQCFGKEKKGGTKRKNLSSRAPPTNGMKKPRTRSILHYYPRVTEAPKTVKVVFVYDRKNQNDDKNNSIVIDSNTN